MMKIAIVNRYFPPSKASTGDLAREFADQIAEVIPSADVVVISTDAEYKGGWSDGKTIKTEVTRTPSYYDGPNQLLRFTSGLIEGRQLAKKAFLEADLVISMTNPPLINLWMGREAKRANKPLIEWTLDIYPLALQTSGRLSSRNPFYKWLKAQVSLHPPHYHLFLGSGQQHKVQESMGYVTPYSIYPCGFKQKPPKSTLPKWKHTDHKDAIWIGYVGNIGEAHSLDALGRFCKKLPSHIQMVFSSYGAKSLKLKKLLKDQENIHWVNSMPDSELLHLDVQLVSLLPAWTHVSVPSKAVSSISLGIPILFIGEKASDTWQMFHKAGWHLPEDFHDEVFEQVLQGFTSEEILHKQEIASNLSAAIKDQIDTSIADLKTFIENYFHPR